MNTYLKRQKVVFGLGLSQIYSISAGIPVWNHINIEAESDREDIG